VAGVVICNPFTAAVVWMGLMTLISAALVYSCLLCVHYRMDVLAGVLMGLSAFKPQLSFLVGVWFLRDRRWLLLAAAAATLTTLLWSILTTRPQGGWLGFTRLVNIRTPNTTSPPSGTSLTFAACWRDFALLAILSLYLVLCRLPLSAAPAT
jgi:hypothetical protein